MTTDVEVELLDDAAPSTRTVVLRPRRRGRELLLVVAAIAAVVGVGLLGDDEEDATASPTTTSSERRTTSTTRARPSTTRRAAVAQPSTTRRPTPTTTWPQLESGTGPLLPGPSTGSFLGVVDSTGHVTVIDLSTGDRCVQLASPEGAWPAWNVPAMDGQMLVQTNERPLVTIDRTCGMGSIDAIDFNSAYVIAHTSDTAWIAAHDPSMPIREIAFPSGEPTGRTYELPRSGGTVVALGDDLVIGTHGSMTLVDPDDGGRRDLGTGTPLAAHGDRLAYVTCPRAECQLRVLDIVSGDEVAAQVEAMPWEDSAFSPDGRYLRVALAGTAEHDGVPSTAIVEVETGAIRTIDTQLQTTAFTADGRWLVGNEFGTVWAFSVDGSHEDVKVLTNVSDLQGFALL